MKDFYNEVNIDERIIEVVYISSDRNEQDFKETYKHMPWMSFLFSDPRHKDLTLKLDITEVPKVYTLDAGSGFLITQKSRKDICDLGVNCLKNWAEEMPDMVKK